MKKRKSKQISGKSKTTWTVILIIVLLLAAVFTGMKSSFYGVAIGILIGFLVSTLMKQVKN